MTTDTVLVTGAFGLVGSAVVEQLAGAGRHVVATDLDIPANRKLTDRLAHSGRVEVRWADLTDDAAVDGLLTAVEPAAIVHLAAVIPPHCYARRALARKVNVGATESLVRAAAALASPPRFVLASSVAVYGARNPHRFSDHLTATTPVNPSDLYGAHKVEAEAAVTSSGLDWVILRLGGVLASSFQPSGAARDLLHLEAALPADGRLQTVDVRDVAHAFGAATVTEATKEVFLVGGDDTHRVLQGELGHAFFDALGLVGGLPPGRPGDPDDDGAWFATDWMDTTRSQEVLSFQRHSLPELLAGAERTAGRLRWLLRMAAPAMRLYLRRTSPNRGLEGRYADPWGVIARKWGDPSPES